EKGFFDFRFQLFPSELETYEASKQSLAPPREEEQGADKQSWQEIFKRPEYHIDHLIVSFPEQMRERTMPVIKNLCLSPAQCPLIYLNGRTSIFAWNEGPSTGARPAFQSLQFDPNKLAYTPDVPERQQAPEAGPAEPPQKRGIWATFLNGPPQR